MRGIAAISVVLHHLGQSLYGVASSIRMPYGVFSSGYHAVDFFFMLSGFVIAAAYEPKMRAGLSFRDYASLRLGRLYPTLCVGTLVALLLLPVQSYPHDLALSLASQLTLLPFLAGAALMYPLNAVQWSIFFELLVNAAHHLVLRRLGSFGLLGICAATGGFLLAVCWVGGSISGGWWLESAPLGLARAMFGFCAGLLIRRHHASLKAPALPLAVVAAVLVAVLALPPLPGLSQVQDAIIVLAILPLMLIFAIKARVSRPQLAGLAGGLSYPLYAVHLPIVSATAGLIAESDPGIAWAWMLGSVGLSIALAAVIWRLLPVGLGGAMRSHYTGQLSEPLNGDEHLLHIYYGV